MKKIYYIVGAVVIAAAIFAVIAIMLKKLKVSLCIEGIDDNLLDEDENNGEVTLSFDDSESDIETVIAD